jgi:hypothetical protein
MAPLKAEDKLAYWDSHDIKADAKLARELFNGRIVRNQRRVKTEFPDVSREAIQPLLRLLLHGVRRLEGPLHAKHDAFLEALIKVVQALDPDGRSSRKLVLRFREQNRSDTAADLQILLHVGNLRIEGTKNEAAVKSASEEFKLSRSNVMAAIRRAKTRLRALGMCLD